MQPKLIKTELCDAVRPYYPTRVPLISFPLSLLNLLETKMTGPFISDLLGDLPIVNAGQLLSVSSCAGLLMLVIGWSPVFIFRWIGYVGWLCASAVFQGGVVVIPLFVFMRMFSMKLHPQIRDGFWGFLSQWEALVMSCYCSLRRVFDKNYV